MGAHQVSVHGAAQWVTPRHSQDNLTHHELAVDMEDWSGNRRFARCEQVTLADFQDYQRKVKRRGWSVQLAWS